MECIKGIGGVKSALGVRRESSVRLSSNTYNVLCGFGIFGFERTDEGHGACLCCSCGCCFDRSCCRREVQSRNNTNVRSHDQAAGPSLTGHGQQASLNISTQQASRHVP